MLTVTSDITVLTIDDEPVVRESIAAYLGDSGFTVLEAKNGREGLEVFHSKKPDIILVDLRMPEVDGLDVLADVTRETPETPIIVVSGTGVLQDAIEALRLGAWDYVIKPIHDMAILEHAVIKALERARLLVENREYREHLEEEIKKRTKELEERTRELEITNVSLKKEIEEHKRTEEENKKLEAQLRQSQKLEAIGTLAGGIAHDFNNILFPIIGYAEMTIDELTESSPVSKNLKGILKAADRARNLVGQILTFSRESDGERNALKIQPIIKEALKLIRATLPATIDIKEDIDDECGPVIIDPTQIHQVIMNLCTNAYHAMFERGVLEVVLKKIQMDDDDMRTYPDLIIPGVYLRLSISDTGHGMNKNVIERIFDPYFTTKEPGKGTGLGLSVVHGIIKHHSGHIAVYSEPGKGTVFHIYLPLIEKKSSKLEIQNSHDSVPKGNERILLVDDEKEIVIMEKQMLEHLGYHDTMSPV